MNTWILGFALACGVTLAQAQAPSGAYGFLFTSTQLDSFGRTGGAIVGILNFESDGKLTVSGTGKGRSPFQQTVDTFTGSGSYTQNEDGTFALKFDDEDGPGVRVTPYENGKGLYIIDTECFACGFNIPFVAREETMTGSLPVSLVARGAQMTVPVTLTRTSGPQARVAVFSLSNAASANGTIPMCSDGASGTWTAEVGALTVALQLLPPDRPNVAAGNFFASMTATVCGETFVENTSGQVDGNVTPTGQVNLMLRARPREVGSGFGRPASGTVKGTYSVQLNFSPFPAAATGSIKFDGEGNMEFSQWFIGGPIDGHIAQNLTGTYSVKPDNTGTIFVKNAAGVDVPTWAFVVTDNGTQLMLLRIDTNVLGNLAYATARLQ